MKEIHAFGSPLTFGMFSAVREQAPNVWYGVCSHGQLLSALNILLLTSTNTTPELRNAVCTVTIDGIPLLLDETMPKDEVKFFNRKIETVAVIRQLSIPTYHQVEVHNG